MSRNQSFRSNSAASVDPAVEVTESIDGLSITASSTVESIREAAGPALDVNEAFAKWVRDIAKYADRDFDKEVRMSLRFTQGGRIFYARLFKVSAV